MRCPRCRLEYANCVDARKIARLEMKVRHLEAALERAERKLREKSLELRRIYTTIIAPYQN